MDTLECSVWNNGGSGWGLKVLGGSAIRNKYFRRDRSPVYVELDGTSFPINIDKKGFWTGSCRELIGVALRDWITKHQLRTGDRVWLGVVKPYHTFKACLVLPTKAAA